MELESPDVWDNPENAQALGQKKVALEKVVNGLETLFNGLADIDELLEMALAEEDEEAVDEFFSDIVLELDELEKEVAELEFRRMFSGEM
ncbi:MAG: PCRF domain-containing protein, partial [Gammaproteobacteria bacterium]|nr:PCRF domain-containing protein [Gammaproteobacteria bacterium]